MVNELKDFQEALLVHKVANRFVEAMKSATAEAFLVLLGSKIVQYDMAVSARESKRGRPNIYRLGLLLEAKQKAEAAASRIMDKDDEESLMTLKKTISKFLSPELPPVKSVFKQIDAWIKDKKYPSLVK